MNILFDIVHPGHVLFFQHMIEMAKAMGHSTKIIARHKDVTCGLLDELGYPYTVIGRDRPGGLAGKFVELIYRDIGLALVGLGFRPDLILTRNPSGVQAARVLGVPGLFDTDDGPTVGVHYWAAHPFADIITTPRAISVGISRRQVRYPGYKQSAYLHPDLFTPDPSVRTELGLDDDEPFFIVRFVAFNASHDVGEGAMSAQDKREMIRRLQAHGRVFVSSEKPLDSDLAHLAFPLPASRFIHALAFAHLVVGESASVSAEAAMLGVPNIRVSTFARRQPVLVELEERYGLVREFLPDEMDEFFVTLDEYRARNDLTAEFVERRDKMLAETVNLAQWFVDRFEAMAARDLRALFA